MNHTTQMLAITGRRILLVVGLLFSSTVMQASYTVGALDTTANGGTGYGNATPGSALGYVITNIGGSDQTNGCTIQPDGKTLVVGQQGSSSAMAVVRYNINGTLDTTFDGDGIATTTLTGTTISSAYAVTVLPNGKIIVVGQALTNGGRLAFFVAQFLPTGALDIAGFGGGAGFVLQNVSGTSVDIANAVAVDSSGLIYVVGRSTDTVIGNIFVARFLTNGTLDTTYNSGALVGGTNSLGVTTIAGIGLLASGALTLYGYGVAIDANLQPVICGAAGTDVIVTRFTTSGILDATFNAGGTPGYNIVDLGGTADVAYAVGFQTVGGNAGKIIIAGTTNDSTGFVAVARFTNSGVLDTTFGIASSGYNTANHFDYTGAYARGLAIQADDKIVIGGTAIKPTLTRKDFVIARYLADGSALDTGNFGATPANGYTITNIGGSTIEDLGNALSLQQNGSFILAGKTGFDFGTARYLGDQLIQGAMDYSYNRAVSSSPGAPGFSLYPPDTDSTSTDLPQVTAIYPLSGTSAGKLYALTQKTANSQIVELAIGGGNQASSATVGQVGGLDVIADSQNRAVVVGTNGTTNGWIARYQNIAGNMTIDSTFNSGSVKVETTNSSSFMRVAEQKAGRLIVIGQSATSSIGLLIAYNENGELANSSQSVCEPFGSGDIGFITLTSSSFKDLIIDANDGIYVAYITGSNELKVAKFLADGSGLSTADFGTGGIIDTGVFASTYAAPCIAFDTDGNILLAAAAGGSGNILLQRITNATGTSISSNILTQATTLLTSSGMNLTKIQCDTSNRLYFNGYDANDFFVGRCGAGSLNLDAIFAPYSSCPGIMKTMYSTNNPSRVSNSVCISSYTAGGAGSSSNGAILFGGYENISAGVSTISLVGQAVGWTSGTVATQVNRFPGALLSGTIDTAYGTDGAKDLTTTLSLPSGQAKAINVITTGAQAGKMLVADSNGTTTTVAMLDATGTALDANAFDTGVSSVTLSDMPQAAAIMVDPTGLTFYVLGTNGAVRSFTYGSTTVTTFATSLVTTGYAITQQASGRILVAGKDVSNVGMIAAYTPEGVIDTSFNPMGLGGQAPNTAGYWSTDLTNPITAISVGTVSGYEDKIYFAYDNVDGYAQVDRLLENGTQLDSDFIFGTTIICSDVTQIKMQLDLNGKIVLVVQTGGVAGIQAARYTANGANDVVAFTVLADSYGATLHNILSLSDGTTLILGAVSNATATSAFLDIARLTSVFALDTTFNSASSTPGILSTNVPSSSDTPVMSDFYGLDVITAGGILISGDNSPTAASAHPVLAAVINTSVVTKVSQSTTALGAAGELDTTFNTAGTNAGFMNLRTEVTSGFPATTAAKVLFQLPNGTAYYVAGSTASDTYVMQMSDDDIQIPGWAGGLLTISGKAAVSGILYAQNGGLVIIGGAGSSGSNAGWAAQYSAADGALYTDFVPTVFLDAHYAIAQQSNGRILVAGINGDVGAIIAYNPITGAVDTTFGVNGIYTGPSGYSAINSIIVDTSDNIYIIGNVPDPVTSIQLLKISSDGTTALATAGLLPWSTSVASNHIAFDTAGNIISATVYNNNISLCSFTSTLNTPESNFVDALGAVTSPTITSMLIDENDNIVITGYGTVTATTTPFIARYLNNGLTHVISGLDTAFNSPNGYQLEYGSGSITGTTGAQWNAGMINANGKITVAGYEILAGPTITPYLMRVYGDEFIGQYLPAVSAGVPGTINTNFATTGYLSLIGTATATAVPQVVLPATSGGAQYVAFSDGSAASTIARYTNANVLDTTYNTTGIATPANAGLYSMSFLANGGLLVAGTIPGGDGWVQQYTTAGILDPTFNFGSPFNIGGMTTATVAVQQSLSRIVVAGQHSSGSGLLVGLTNTGSFDATFADSSTYILDVATPIYAMVADEYDRLLIAYKNGTAISIRRLTSSGQLDTTFGTGGTIADAIGFGIEADDATQVRIVLNAAGNIVLAAHIDSDAVEMTSYDTNGTTQLYFFAIPYIPTQILTGLIATADGKVLVSGNNTTTPYRMWVARILAAGGLDTTFNPDTATEGIMEFAPGAAATPTARSLNSIAIYGDGEISMVGTEISSSGTANNPFMSRAYNDPYTSQEPIDLKASAPGTIDLTLGAGVSPNYVANGITFFATTDGIAQYAKAVVMQDGNDNGVLVAFDGTSTSITNSAIYLNMFDVDGLLNTSFKPSTVANTAPGQLLVLSMFENQYVNDMLTFTVGGVSKAILAGYATNSTPSATGSLLMQCVLTASVPGLDPDFGGLNNNSLGVAFGDGQSLNTVGLQSNGRIIAGGLDQSGNGLLLGYTPAGNLDQSFGQGGTFAQGTTGVYTSAIDTQDRLVIAYRVGSTVTLARILADGSGLDTTFGVSGIVTTTITTAISNSNLRLVIDGSNNIAVVAVLTGGTTFAIARYTSGGVLSTAVNTIGGTMSLTAFTITKLLVDTNGAIVVVGYDNAVSDEVVVARLVYSSTQYILDSTFNASAGFIKYEVNSTTTQQTVGAFIHPDGRIIIGGAQH